VDTLIGIGIGAFLLGAAVNKWGWPVVKATLTGIKRWLAGDYAPK